MEVKASIQMLGGYGNPNGSGKTEDVLLNLPVISPSQLNTDLKAFYTALATVFSASVGDIYLTAVEPVLAAKPGNSVNIDEVLKVDWSMEGEKGRKMTLQGVPLSCPHIVEQDAGRRLSASGITAVKDALDDLYGGPTVVQRGIFIRKA